MASVFLSYDHEDLPRAKAIARALENAGHSVWWDRHIKGGTQYSKEIEQSLAAAGVVVVLWSHASVESAWVRDEAAAGRDSGRLMPVLIEKVAPPMGFRQYQTIDLSGWSPRRRSSQFDQLLEAVIAAAGEVAPQAVTPHHFKRTSLSPRRISAVIVALAVLALAVLTLLWWQPWKTGSKTISIAVVAAAHDQRSEEIARSLVVDLAELQSSNLGSISLTGAPEKEIIPDFILQIDSAATGKPSANIVLQSGRDQTVLWTDKVETASANPADFRQELGYAAAGIISCAIETQGEALGPDVLRLYLNGCAIYARNEGLDAHVRGIFNQVVTKTPTFKEAWAKLLLAEYAVIANPDNFSREAVASLTAHVAAAQQLEPRMPEALIIKSFLAFDDFTAREKFLTEALTSAPDNAHVHDLNSQFLLIVGRMREGVSEAERATALNPLSPALEGTYVTALNWSGRTNDALIELDRADKKWPDTTTNRFARYSILLRNGDPKELIRFAQNYAISPIDRTFLAARIERTPKAIDQAVAASRTSPNIVRAISNLAQTLGEFGRNDDLFRELMAYSPSRPSLPITTVLFRPPLKSFRHDIRFMRVAKHLGLVNYWQKSGHWPDFCGDPDLPYNCRQKAAELSAPSH